MSKRRKPAKGEVLVSIVKSLGAFRVTVPGHAPRLLRPTSGGLTKANALACARAVARQVAAQAKKTRSAPAPVSRKKARQILRDRKGKLTPAQRGMFGAIARGGHRRTVLGQKAARRHPGPSLGGRRSRCPGCGYDVPVIRGGGLHSHNDPRTGVQCPQFSASILGSGERWRHHPKHRTPKRSGRSPLDNHKRGCRCFYHARLRRGGRRA